MNYMPHNCKTVAKQHAQNPQGDLGQTQIPPRTKSGMALKFQMRTVEYSHERAWNRRQLNFRLHGMMSPHHFLARRLKSSERSGRKSFSRA